MAKKIELEVTSMELWAVKSAIGSCQGTSEPERAKIRGLIRWARFTKEEEDLVQWEFIEMPPGQPDEYRFYKLDVSIHRRLTRGMRKKLVELLKRQASQFRSGWYGKNVGPVLERLGHPLVDPEWPDEKEYEVELQCGWLSAAQKVLERATSSEEMELSRILDLTEWARLSEEEERLSRRAVVKRILTKIRQKMLLASLGNTAQAFGTEWLMDNIDPLREALGEEISAPEWEDDEEDEFEDLTDDELDEVMTGLIEEPEED